MSRHVIETLQWTCRSTDRQPGLAQQSMSDFLHGPGARMLETVFDRLSAHGEVWRIDQLEIDLGEVPAPTDAGEWARRLELALDTALRRLRQDDTAARLHEQPAHTIRRVEDRELEHFLYYLEHGRLHWSMAPLASGGMADWLARLTKQIGPRLWPALLRLPHADRTLRRLGHITPCHGLQALLALRHSELAHALEHLDDSVLEPLRAQGRLSAYQLAQVRQAWRVAGLQALWGQGSSALGVARVQRLLAALGSSLLAQLGESDASRLGAWLDTSSPAWAATGLQRSLWLGVQSRLLGAQPDMRGQDSRKSHTRADGEGASGDLASEVMLTATWHESLRQFALVHQSDPNVRAAGWGLSDLQAYLLDYSLAYLSEAERVPQDHVAWQQVWNHALLALTEASKQDFAHSRDHRGLQERPVPPSEPVLAAADERPKIRTSRNSDGTVSPADDHPDNEAIYIANAGLVLLANYAPRLFGMLGLLQEGAFVDEAARHRAVHCLVYLSDGHTDTEEHEWVLNKLLCGVPIEAPVPPAKSLDAIKPTLDSLLPAVIAHWTALGNTSPAGLRQTFLRRIGRLIEHETYEVGHWRLKVQPAAFDLLLDRLPWSYGTIKLPWMKGAIHVDWR
jgi:Contractile injection system tape measure protein